MVKEMDQFKEVIRGFDENLALKAHKQDLHTVLKGFRDYTKLTKFEKYKAETQDLLNKVEEDNNTITSSFALFNATIEDKIRERVKKETQHLRMGQDGNNQPNKSSNGRSALE